MSPETAKPVTFYPPTNRAEQAKVLREQGKTQREIAEALGVSQPTIVVDLSENRGIPQKTDKPKRNQVVVRLSPGTDPVTAVARIREKLGEEFAEALRKALSY